MTVDRITKMMIALMCGFLVCWVPSVRAAVPDTIAYQGRLTDDTGAPVPDGTYSMRFYLFDAATGGGQVWNSPDGEEQAVDVAGGVYDVQLGAISPLGSAIFDGGTVWLEVVVYNADTTTWEILSPRQPVTAVAYALKAGDADTLEGVDASGFAPADHAHDALYVNEGQASAVTAGMIAASAVTSGNVADNSLTAADLGPSSVGSDEIIDGSVTAADLQDGAARAEILDDDGPGSGLDADYLDGLSSGSFVQTTQDYGRSGVAANLYEGTSSLASKYVDETGDTMTGQLTTNTVGRGILVDANPIASTLYGIYIDADQSADNNYQAYGLYVDTDSAASSTSVYGTYANAQKSTGTTGSLYGAYNYSFHSGTGGTTYGNYSTAYGSDSGDVYGMFGYAYKYSTDTAGNAYGGRFIANNYTSGSAYAVYADASATGGTNIAVRGTATGGDYNYALYGSATGGTSWAGYLYGPVGVDTYGTGNDIQSVTIDPDDKTIELFETDGTRTILLDGESGTEGGPYLYMYNNSGVSTVYIDGDSADAGYISLRNASGTTTITLDGDYSGDGRITTQELQITGGSDLSEQFDIQDSEVELSPGLVVSIDPNAPGHLKVSQSAYDNKVAGIISGAGGIKSGLMMGQSGTPADGRHPVALTGRVYCWADASAGAIMPGDLLTTSDIPGHAMKVADHGRANGAILGKAMTALASGKGLVLVLVSLQ